MADALDDIVESSPTYLVATGFEFTEGPLWHPDGYLLFVDIRTSIIYRVTPGSPAEVYRDNSGGSNGLTFDLEGRLIMCEGDGRRISRREADGSITNLADRWEGKRIHRPNDVVCKSDGSLYFTNPSGRIDPADREIDFAGVHRIMPDGTVTAVVTDTEYPNGLAFSPDERVLYVANTRESMHINAYDVGSDGACSNGRVFADMSSDEPDGVPDGMKVDSEGRSILHRPRRLLGLRRRRPGFGHHPPARNSGQLRLGRPGQPDYVLHRPHLGVQLAHEDAGHLPLARWVAMTAECNRKATIGGCYGRPH